MQERDSGGQLHCNRSDGAVRPCVGQVQSMQVRRSPQWPRQEGRGCRPINAPNEESPRRVVAKGAGADTAMEHRQRHREEALPAVLVTYHL